MLRKNRVINYSTPFLYPNECYCTRDIEKNPKSAPTNIVIDRFMDYTSTHLIKAIIFS